MIGSLTALRWDRLGRFVLIGVFILVTAIGIQRGMSYMAARAQAGRSLAMVQKLKVQNAKLAATQKSLSEPSTIAADARKLGMVHVGEHPYSVTGNH